MKIPKCQSLRVGLILACALFVASIGSNAMAQQVVKLEGRQLVTDYDQNGTYEPYFVKGIGYAPIPIGHFIGRGIDWQTDCWYVAFWG